MKKSLRILDIEEKTISKLDAYLSEGTFRNKSHLIEFAIDKFMKEIENERS